MMADIVSMETSLCDLLFLQAAINSYTELTDGISLRSFLQRFERKLWKIFHRSVMLWYQCTVTALKPTSNKDQWVFDPLYPPGQFTWWHKALHMLHITVEEIRWMLPTVALQGMWWHRAGCHLRTWISLIPSDTMVSTWKLSNHKIIWISLHWGGFFIR